MFLTVGMTLGIRVPVVGPLKDINFQKHSGAPLAVLVYIYIYYYYYIYIHIYVYCIVAGAVLVILERTFTIVCFKRLYPELWV